MTILYLEGTEDSPSIVLDKSKGVFEISGRSIPEDATEFYRPVLDWIMLYRQTPNSATEFVFKFEYFNTATLKIFQEILTALEKVPGIKILWYYDKGDLNTEETVLEYTEMLKIPFELKHF